MTAKINQANGMVETYISVNRDLQHKVVPLLPGKVQDTLELYLDRPGHRIEDYADLLGLHPTTVSAHLRRADRICADQQIPDRLERHRKRGRPPKSFCAPILIEPDDEQDIEFS